MPSPATVAPLSMDRETAIYYHTKEPVVGTKSTFAVFAPAEGDKLPVVLFQSGYGGTSAGHGFLLEKIAESGFIVIAPERTDDQNCGCMAIVGFLLFCPCAALPVDGSHLGLALTYARDTRNKWMDRADLSKVALMGFSMGAKEVVHAQVCRPH